MQVFALNVALIALALAGALIVLFTLLCLVSVFTRRDYVIEFLNLYTQERP